VFIAAPHTSNWDLPFMLATACCLGVRIHWLGKHTLFRRPFGPIMRWLGGVPADRRAPQQTVQSLVKEFSRRERLILAVPPEGTRGKVTRWRSGFYHIARAANVPIGTGFLDFSRRLCGLGPFLRPTGNVHADMEQIRAFYAPIRGRFPDRQCVPRLREEDEVFSADRSRASAPPG
jgi:1-acyl-sn-glycerol-3-phosphate acyltransferase